MTDVLIDELVDELPAVGEAIVNDVPSLWEDVATIGQAVGALGVLGVVTLKDHIADIFRTPGWGNWWTSQPKPSPTISGYYNQRSHLRDLNVLRAGMDRARQIATMAVFAAKAADQAKAYADQRAADVMGQVDQQRAYSENLYNRSVWAGQAEARAVRSEAENLYNQAVWAGQAEAHRVEQIAAAQTQAAVHYSEDLYNRSTWHTDATAAQANRHAEDLHNLAVWHADGLAATARADVANAVARVEADISTATHVAVDEATRIARATITDVVGPVARSVTDFLSGPWRWAIGILKVLEGMLWWLVWVATHLVPEVVAFVKFASDTSHMTLAEIVELGVKTPSHARH